MTKFIIYTFSKCDEADGYFLANCECVCTQTCYDKVTTKPENSYYVEADCKACGTTTKIKDHWECNDGYHKNTAGTSCVADVTESCESKGYNSNPVYNNTYCERVTISINGTSTTCFDCKTCDNQGLIEVKSCEKLCNKFAPDGQSRAYYKFYTIENIDFYDRNNKSTCYRGDLQNHKSDCCCQGSGAVALADCEEPIEPEDCPAGYASTVGECGSQGVAGWELGAKYGSMNCYECKARTCPIVQVKYPIEGNSSGDSAYIYKSVKSTTNSSESLCGTQGANGWNTALTGNYSGDDACYVCKPRFCPIGYSTGKTSVDDCGSEGAAGWKFSTASSTAGDEICGMCTKIASPCPEGFTAGLTDPSQCGVGGEDGWFVEFNGNESCGLCTPKTCGDHGLESTRYSTVCLSEKVYIGNDLVDCYDCVGCDTFDIYNSTGSLYDVYRDSIDIPCSEWCRYDKYTSHTTGAIPYVIYKKPVKDKAGRSGDCYGLADIPGYWEVETNEKKMCCCLHGEDLTPSGCSESNQP